MKKIIDKIGPAIVAIGFSVGTGSVTSFVVAGSKYGTDLLWVNLLSCLFSWACVEAYDRYYLATNETALLGIKNRLPFGVAIAWVIIVGLSYGQYNSLMGNLTTTSNAIFETFNLFFPALHKHAYWVILGVAALNITIMCFILNIGKYQLFEKILAFFVILMSFCFILSLFIAVPDPIETLKGLLPVIPENPDKMRLSVAIVGTTLTAATFITRPLFLQANGWTKEHRKTQRTDAIIASVGLFIIGTAILLLASTTLHKQGQQIEKIFDMVGILEPIAGKFALTIFLVGTLSAGLTAVFPILMVTPMMVSDYQKGKFEMGTSQFKILTIIASIIGLLGPLTGKNPIEMQIFSQVFLVLILPISVIVILVLVNKKSLMKDLAAEWWLNVLLVLAFLFSLSVSYYGLMDILSTLKQW